MTETPKLRLYSEAIYVGDRSELSAIHGQRVIIIGRSADDGNWNYEITMNNKYAESIVCSEQELVPAEPIPLVSDDELISEVVAQTAELRYSIRALGLRKILHDRGIDAFKCLQISCDQGDDVHVTFVLSDGTVVQTDYREDPKTRQAIQFVDWTVQTYSNREIELCRQILAGDTSDFDIEVRRYFDRRFAANDCPLPPID